MNMINRAHGRTGLGAVMGSKQLKAIAVRGSSKKLRIADPELLRSYMKESLPAVKNDPHGRELAQLCQTQSPIGCKMHRGVAQTVAKRLHSAYTQLMGVTAQE